MRLPSGPNGHAVYRAAIASPPSDWVDQIRQHLARAVLSGAIVPADLARRVGVHPNTLRRFVAGQGAHSDTLAAMATAAWISVIISNERTP